MALARGARLGPHEILGLIGEGGMGAVYRARDPRLGRDVAIKIIRGDAVADPDRRARFLQEARAVSALNHPAIVTIHDIGNEDGVTYMVMELVDGKPLDALIHRGGLRVGEILRIGAQIADACVHAHAQRIIHRDLKPANVMVQPDGRVKVLDFGLAKLVEADDEHRDSNGTTQTGAGTILGTAAYMSPEQTEGKSLDPRSDLFSLGAILHEMCTGWPVFAGDSAASTLANVLTKDPPALTTVRPDVPPELARVIARCLRKDPARRVQSAADLKVILDELKEDLDTGRLAQPTHAVGGARRVPWLAVVIATVVAAAVVATAFVWRGRSTEAAVRDVPSVIPLTGYPGEERAGGFSPDGNQIVFSWTGPQNNNQDIYIKLINVEPPLRLTTDPRPDVRPRWSPDGRQIAFVRQTARDQFAVVLVSPLGGPERQLTQLYTAPPSDGGSALASVAWTPDSKSLFVSGATEANHTSDLLRVSVETGDVRTVLAAAPTEGGYGVLKISPDGRSLAAGRLTGEGRVVDVIGLSDTFEPRASTRISAIPSPVSTFAWTGNSRELMYSMSVNNSEPLYRAPVAGGPPVAMPWTGAGAFEPITSGDGKRLAFTRLLRDANIWRIPLGRAGTPEQIADSTFREVAPQYSPDGTRITYFSSRSGSVQIWTADADGSRAVQVTAMPTRATSGTPRWSPDGRHIVFDSNASGPYEIYLVAADGGQPKQITSGSANFAAAFSPDGQWIYDSSDRTGRMEVWRMHPDGSHSEQVTHSGGQDPFLSRDGRVVFFDKNAVGGGVWRMSVDGGDETRVLDGVYRNNFAPVDEGMYFVASPQPDGRAAIRYKDLKTGLVRDVFEPEKPVDLGLTVSPDGKWLLYVTLDYTGADLMLADQFR
jgi:Tol biopolymer transport system component